MKVIFIIPLFFSIVLCKKSEISDIMQYADMYGKRHEYEKALAFSEKALKLDPENREVRKLNSKIYSSIAIELLAIKDFNSSLANAKKAIELFPENDMANNVIAANLSFQEKYKESIPFSLKALKINRNSSTPDHNLANAYRALRDFQSAIKHYKEAIRKGSDLEDELEERLSLVELYRKTGNLRNSQEELEKFEKVFNEPASEPFRKEVAERYKYSKEFLAKKLKD